MKKGCDTNMNINVEVNLECGESNWSQEAIEYLGFSDCKVSNIKETMKDITHPEDKEHLLQEFEEVYAQKKEVLYFSFRIKNANEVYVPCTYKGKMILDEDGKPCMFRGVLTIHNGDEDLDPITDLPKVQSFLSHISEVKKNNKECLLMALKLKHFNNINALYGYDFGNKALYEIAKIMCDVIETRGSVYRLESTSFGIIFNDSNIDGLKECYSLISDALESYCLDGFALNIDMCGGALYTKNYEVSHRMVYSYLLSALEKAKDEEDNKLIVFDDASQENNHKTLALLDVIKGSNRVVVDSSVQCAKRLGLTVCLEGVETKEIKDFIGKYSANYHQGYFYSRPIEFSKFKAVVDEKWPVSNVSLIKETPNNEFGVDSILSMMPGGFFIYADDETEKIISVNEMMLDIFECETLDEFLELTNGSFSGLVHPEDYQQVRRSIYQQINANDKKMDYVRYRIITKTGKVKFVRDYGHLVHVESDVDLFYVFIVEG